MRCFVVIELKIEDFKPEPRRPWIGCRPWRCLRSNRDCDRIPCRAPSDPR
ncbi:hypothetical protein [Rhizobium sp. CNPSo 4039]|nr:hypothetical protein [Rhizobium sp. CNPSo 4039]MDK4717252.1 hypothetical protein [Rhizobium sp. CNPSo 4039]